MKTQIETQPFRIPRTILARLGAEEYLLHFWWLIVGFPLYGVWALFFSGTDALRLTGFVAIAWPLTVPARSLLSTNKAGRFFANGARLKVQGDTLYFVPDGGDGFRLGIGSITRMVTRHGYYILRLRRLGFVAVPSQAFSTDDQRARFEELIGRAVTHEDPTTV